MDNEDDAEMDILIGTSVSQRRTLHGETRISFRIDEQICNPSEPYSTLQLVSDLGFDSMTLNDSNTLLEDAMEEDVEPSCVDERNPLEQELRHLALEAAESGDVEALQRLTWLGVDINSSNAYGESLICVAAKNGNFKMMKYLYDLKCELSMDTFYSAVSGGNADCVKFLMDCGFEESVDLVSRAAEEGNTRIIQELTRKSKDIVNSRDAYGVTPLFYAAREGHEKAVDELIALGAEVDSGILTSLIDENENMFRYLIEKGGDVNTKLSLENSTLTPLLYSSLRNNIDLIQYLLDKGAQINAKNDLGQTSLHIAASSNFTFLTNLLIDKGAVTNCKDNKGLTPLDVAKEKTHQFLLEKGAKSGEEL